MEDNFVKISNSPATGKFRAIEILGAVYRFDLKEVHILTKRHYYNDDACTQELTSSEYAPFEHQINASNSILCNPANGLSVSPDGNGGYVDPLGQAVQNPMGMYDFIRPLFTQNVATMTILKQYVTAEDQVYQTFDK